METDGPLFSVGYLHSMHRCLCSLHLLLLSIHAPGEALSPDRPLVTEHQLAGKQKRTVNTFCHYQFQQFIVAQREELPAVTCHHRCSSFIILYYL